MATTTSLKANPRDRNMNSRPLTTGHAASDGSASGMRLMAALPSGVTTNETNEVRASGA